MKEGLLQILTPTAAAQAVLPVLTRSDNYSPQRAAQRQKTTSRHATIATAKPVPQADTPANTRQVRTKSKAVLTATEQVKIGCRRVRSKRRQLLGERRRVNDFSCDAAQSRMRSQKGTIAFAANLSAAVLSGFYRRDKLAPCGALESMSPTGRLSFKMFGDFRRRVIFRIHLPRTFQTFSTKDPTPTPNLEILRDGRGRDPASTKSHDRNRRHINREAAASQKIEA